MDEQEYQKQVNFVLSRLKEERQKASLSQIELSFAAAGRNIPNLYTLIKICNALKIRPEILFSTPNEEREKARNEIITLVKKYI